jgi:hypothetical protein
MRLFDNAKYKFSNVTKFLGGVSVDHSMAKINLREIADNIADFSKAIDGIMVSVPGIDGIMIQISYPLERLHKYLDSPCESGLTDQDASIFVYYMLDRYMELIEMANELDAEINK